MTGDTFLPDISEMSLDYQLAVQHHRRHIITTITRNSDHINGDLV
jgi:hypothetical protein